MYIELWKWIPGYEGYYMASTHGRVKSVDRYVGYKKSGQRLMKGKILKQNTDKVGYKIVQLNKNGKGKLFKVHRLVAQVFLENSSNLPQVNHKDENKQNNNVDNLEWISPKDNMNYGTRNERISKTKKGRQFTEEHRKNISKNNAKYWKGKKGKDSAYSKPVLMFTKNDEFIKRFDCVADANEFLEKDRCNHNICLCARGINKTAFGFKWVYEEDFDTLSPEQQMELEGFHRIEDPPRVDKIDTLLDKLDKLELRPL